MVVTELTWPVLISLLISFVIPLLVGLVTKWSTNPTLKALLLLLFASVNALLTQILVNLNDHAAFSWKVLLLNAVLNFVVAVAAHFGLWKPTNTTAKAQSSLVKDKPPIE